MTTAAKWTTDLESDVRKDAMAIRFKVFVDEQEVPEDLEIDELEADSHHLVLYVDRKPVATARIYEIDDGYYKIQRVAVYKDQRGKGYGAQAIQEAEKKIRELGGTKIILGAQLHALPFYEKLGYQVSSEEYMDAGIPHHDVTKKLN